uniref:Uncharacterized protein n=1 Tax=viral metagenome TaxID=1070528 RepID=A0A6C0H1X6_9ZZZZ
MNKYIDPPLIYNSSNLSKDRIKGIVNLFFKSKSKDVGIYNCPSCSFKSNLTLYKNKNILFDNSMLHHVIEHNYKPDKIILNRIKKTHKIKINATFTKEKQFHKFILDRNQIFILDSLMNIGKEKVYIDKSKNFRYSEHAGLLDFDHTELEKILISGKTNRQDRDDPEILLPQNMKEALDYEFMFHTHPPTPYPGARAKVGVLYEFPSISDIFHFIEHYNIGETQASLIIAPEGFYIIHSKTGENKIEIKDEKFSYKNLVNGSFEIQNNAIEKYGKNFENNNKFYDEVINDKKFINQFNNLLKKYLDDQIYIEYIARIKDSNGNYIINKLIIELKSIERKN